MKDFISIESGVLLKKIIIPVFMQTKIMAKLRLRHEVIEKIPLLARRCVYWRGIDQDIESLISKCYICLKYSRCEQKGILLLRDLPTRAWQYIGTDLLKLNVQNITIVADDYSKIPLIINSESSKTVIQKLKTIFDEHGIPDMVFSDEEPCHASGVRRVYETLSSCVITTLPTV